MTLRRAILLDCDGVLLDSNALKTAAFGAVLRAYPQDIVTSFLHFQSTAFGISRYRLFDAFFERYLIRPPAPGERDALLEDFSRLCVAGYRDCAFTDGALDAVAEINAAGMPLYVVSGSDERELREVLAGKSVLHCFDAVFGSPASKVDNIRKVGALLGERQWPMVFVGDAKADFEASRTEGCEFLYMGRWSADRGGMQKLKDEHGFREIESLAELLPTIAQEATCNGLR